MAQILEFKKKEPPSDPRWDEVRQYAGDGRRDQALAVLEDLADDGYAGAYYLIGLLFEEGGDGVTQDLDAARAWYLEAIDTIDDDDAYVGMARLALNGYEDAGTVADAIDYLGRACEVDNIDGIIALALVYHDGKGVPRDLERAAALYEKAWALGYVIGLRNLASVRLAQRRYLAGVRLRIKAGLTAYRIVKKDPQDPRLAGCMSEWMERWLVEDE